MVHSLGSRTSGVDGSSEGGRINTIDIPGALVIYGVALLQALQPKNPKSKLSVAPVKVDGIFKMTDDELDTALDQNPRRRLHDVLYATVAYWREAGRKSPW